LNKSPAEAAAPLVSSCCWSATARTKDGGAFAQKRPPTFKGR
jgi:hypothetical protein